HAVAVGGSPATAGLMIPPDPISSATVAKVAARRRSIARLLPSLVASGGGAAARRGLPAPHRICCWTTYHRCRGAALGLIPGDCLGPAQRWSGGSGGGVGRESRASQPWRLA